MFVGYTLTHRKVATNGKMFILGTVSRMVIFAAVPEIKNEKTETAKFLFIFVECAVIV